MASTRKEGEQLYADINAGGRTHLDVETTDFNVLVAGAKYTSYMCAAEELDFLECKAKDENPRACVPENVALTECAHAALDKISRQCASEFDEVVDCLESPSVHGELSACRHARFGVDVVVEERKRRMASLQTWASTRRRPQPTIIRPREQKKVDAAVAKYKKEHDITE
ncbi:uncharacterized protein ACA1_078010 [Acanthamoeba castellanii str. Neff]|uniref:Uncharacterized protein n=1 Tax=Acanthamoeba castellanii (strain ATCC 30010 / Neff) TaxID=1257118 RepID=L8GND2_ACACF|nr:uncharacterized protein ACA1_078010 [Acanthamoeba castellanii str. Neff]ELR14570.1 hypothetical protein ACA1_078010 [Acanthamoeba castellanii str. Neff]